MNPPRIGGIEPPEPTPTNPESVAAAPATPMTENPSSAHPAFWQAGRGWRWIASVALLIGTGVGLYTHHLQIQITRLQAQLNQTSTNALVVGEKLNHLRLPRDLSAEVASLEVTVTKLRAAEDSLRRSFDHEIQKIPALEARLSDLHSALTAHQGRSEAEWRTIQEQNEARLATLLTVLRNQDTVLRRLVETASSAERKE